MLRFGKKNQSKGENLVLPWWIWGRDYGQPGQTYTRSLLPHLAAGIGPGHKKCLLSKVDGNEDAMGLLALAKGHLLLLADSHFGKFAAEMALSQFEGIFQTTIGPIQQRLFHTFLALDSSVRKSKVSQNPPVHPGCATTLIAAWVGQESLAWCSIGDSSFWCIRDGQAKLENEHTQNFLGDSSPLHSPLYDVLESWGWLMDEESPSNQTQMWWLISQLNRTVRGLGTRGENLTNILSALKKCLQPNATFDELELKQAWHPFHILAQSVLPEWGARPLKQGDRLFLASDGVDEPASLASIETLLDLACQVSRTPTDTVERILNACHGRRGGGDNLMCWVMDIDSAMQW